MGEQKYASKPDAGITVLLDQAHRAQEEYRDILDRRAALRESLRSMVVSGLTTKEQAQQVEELYPPRGKNNNAAAAA